MEAILAHVGSGTYEPLQIGPLLVAAIAYARRTTTLAGRGSPVPVWRQACFAAGVVVILASLVSPISHIAEEELLTAHMAQHLLLGDVAALLIVLGLTGPILQPLLAIRWLGWIRHPAHLVALPIWVATLYVWHVPALYEAALTSEPVHVLEHGFFLGAGILIWMGLLGPLPQPDWFGLGAKVIYVGAVRLAGAALGNVFMWSGTVLYPAYAGGERYWGISPLSDQGIAGAVMMGESTIVTIAVLSWLFLRWAAEDTERQRLLDLADARGVPLDAARATRAVAAGEGARLEERLLRREAAAPASGPVAPRRGQVRAVSRNRFLYLFVFVVGTASLGAEIAAARLMAPFFGASTIVWANTIGVVLAALSAGYWIGGRIGDRYPHMRGLSLLVLGAAVLLAIVPFAAKPLFEVSVGALDEISAGAFAGSLFGVLVLLAVPVMMLGAAAPYAIRLAVPDVEHSGRTSGRLYAVSTVGSLLGTWLSALLLIPLIGTQRTFLCFALAVAVIAVVGLGWRYSPVPAVLLALVAIPVGTVKATGNGTVVYETETETQYVRVVHQQDGDIALELNEGQAIHSLRRPGTYLTDNVWDGYLVAPFAALDEPPERIAILGNAAGTTARAYGHYFPATEVDGVEIDPELTEIGRRFFDLDNPNLEVFHEDARPWLRRSDGGYDVIMVDAYRQPYIPFYLATREFFELVRDRLAPGGVVIVNAGHPEGNDDLETVLGRTMAEAFPTVLRDPITDTNTLLIGSEAPASAERLAEATAELPADLRPVATVQASRIEPRLEGGRVYTDDHAPVEWLIDRSIVGYAADQE